MLTLKQREIDWEGNDMEAQNFSLGGGVPSFVSFCLPFQGERDPQIIEAPGPPKPGSHLPLRFYHYF